ncbi:MAG: ATP-dependent sacrificial sulfur transferase LarE [Candidatus Adiutrix sp.]|jgi:uncharacterized protein|nr:ATP-dependent sacrificial sulfur transferase LarE [Candidatus Adiutrix sp.]
MDNIREKQAQLQESLSRLEGALVAFSGGVDSTFLLKVAHDLLGDRVMAVTARSLSFPQRELEAARNFARENNIRHEVIDSEELDLPGFADNPPDRCYLCKKELFGKMKELAASLGVKHILEASNADDVNDYRPGLRAIAELNILSPLRQAGLTKNEIRQLSRELNLPTWSKPSFACLASRFPYGERISPQNLRQIDEAEQYLLDLGFHQVRVRYHGHLARIEADEEGLARLAEPALREQIYARLTSLGFIYVAVDIRGYRSGSMNETLKNR